MIPKTIHYCWFGGMKPTPLQDMCRESWSRHCPDYEIVEWNDRSFAPYAAPFFDEAMRRRKFAFASDYARAFVLDRFGGIYLDTDVEVRQPLDRYLAHRAFTGFERVGFPFTAVWGSEAGHPLARRVCEHYDDAPFSTVTNTTIVSDLIVRKFGIDPSRDVEQEGADGLAVYPSSTFCVDLEQSTAVHHFAGSWLEQGTPRTPYKTIVSIIYHANQLDEHQGLSHPAMFSIIREKVGIRRYVTDFLYWNARHYGGFIRLKLKNMVGGP